MDSLGRALEARIEAGDIELPVFPEAARRITELCDADECDMSEMAQVLRADPTLTAHFLRLANSALFGGRGAIVALPQALARLGTEQTRKVAWMIVLQAKVFASTSRREATERLRAHSVATALWAQELGRLKRLNVEELFLAGLLRDVGVPALYPLVEELGPADAAHVEAAVMGVHHRVGADIARRWALSPRLADIIRHHHACPDTLRAGGQAWLSPIVAVLQLADVCAVATCARRELVPASLVGRGELDALGLYVDDLEVLFDKQASIGEAARALG